MNCAPNPTSKNDQRFWTFVLLAWFPLWLRYRLGELLRFARARRLDAYAPTKKTG